MRKPVIIPAQPGGRRSDFALGWLQRSLDEAAFLPAILLGHTGCLKVFGLSSVSNGAGRMRRNVLYKAKAPHSPGAATFAAKAIL